MVLRSAIALAALVLITAQTPLAAKPLVCPNNAAAAKAIPADDLASLTADAFDRSAKINRVVTILRDRGMNSASIVDNLISAYCPVVAANAVLNDQQKTTAVRSFAAQVARAVYTSDSAEEIILDVALPADIANAVNSKAQAARMSPQEWAARAIANEIKAAR